jgi:amidase
MRRREFVERTVRGAAALAVAPVPAGTSPLPEALPQMVSSVPAFELDETTIADLQKGMAAGQWTARSLGEAYLQRIEQVDRQGPGLRAILETNPDALAIADELDRERKARGPRGPLHGIPVLVKDNLDTHDRMTNTAGSLALEGSHPAQDSTVVQKLRAAGAVILAKTNLSEWANIRSTKSSSGWSARGGQCRNPYSLDRSPCGSSSGSGAATAANLGAVSIGTETDGSIVCPASANGLVGLKPTVGLVSRAGIIPISHSQDTAGPMCRSVADAAAVLSAIAGEDARDAGTAASAGKTHSDYTRFLDGQGLRGARLGVARKYFGFHPAVDKLMDAAFAEMKKQGAELIDPVDLPNDPAVGAAELEILLYELKHDLNNYLATLGPGARVKTLADVIKFNEENREREMPYFGQELFLQAQEKGPLTSKPYLAAVKKCAQFRKTYDALLTKHRLDAFISPTDAPAWCIDLVNGDHYMGGSSSPAAIAGHASINVPLGLVHGLPVGILFYGRAWSEGTLIKLAYSFEQATRHRRPPKFVHHAVHP